MVTDSLATILAEMLAYPHITAEFNSGDREPGTLAEGVARRKVDEWADRLALLIEAQPQQEKEEDTRVDDSQYDSPLAIAAKDRADSEQPPTPDQISPLPWTWRPCETEGPIGDNELIAGAQLYDASGKSVFTEDCGDYQGLSDTNAAFIARCVNVQSSAAPAIPSLALVELAELALSAFPDSETAGPDGAGYKWAWDELSGDEQEWVKDVRRKVTSLLAAQP